MSDAMVRASAAKLAREILTGLDHDREDILIVADWLVTGTADLAMRFTEHTSSLYRQNTPDEDESQFDVWRGGAG